jgi:hypothetical protein
MNCLPEIEIPDPPPPVRRIERFALAPEDAASARDGARAVRDGAAAVPLRVPGATLLAQFEAPHGFLLVTEGDDPYEVATHFTLLAPDARRVVCSRLLGGWYGSAILRRLAWRDARRFSVRFDGVPRRFEFAILGAPMPPAGRLLWLSRPLREASG